MPKSKRARIVHTSVVQKKPAKERSATLFSAIQAAADAYQHIFVFRVDNMRNTYLKDVRSAFAGDGRLFFGKTKVMAKALGSGAADEPAPGLGGLAAAGYVRGSVGLLCTNRTPADVLAYFADFAAVDFARAGVVAPRGFTVPAGVVLSRGGELPAEDDVPLPHSLEPTLRRWGMPSRLDKGRVVLDQPFAVCEPGRELNSHQTALLKLFGVALAEFRVEVLAYWSAATQEVTEVEQGGGAMDDEDEA